MLELHVHAGVGYELASLDPFSNIAASYAQLVLGPGHYQLVRSGNAPPRAPSLPCLVHHDGALLSSAAPVAPHVAVRDALLVLNDSVGLSPDDKALCALLDRELVPLVLHSLYSLPENWAYVRRHLALCAPSLFPFSSVALREIRARARLLTGHSLWGQGGEPDDDDDDGGGGGRRGKGRRLADAQRKRRLLGDANASLFDRSPEQMRETDELDRRDRAERARRRFGESKVASRANAVLETLSSLLAASQTPYLFSAPSPGLADAHLAALMAPLLFLPLPNPLVRELVGANAHSRVWQHASLVRRVLFQSCSSSSPPSASDERPSAKDENAAAAGWPEIHTVKPALLPPLGDLLPFFPSRQPRTKKASSNGNAGSGGGGSARFTRRRRLEFAALVALGIAAWAIGTGTLALRLGSSQQQRLVHDDDDDDDEYDDDEGDVGVAHADD